MSILALCLLNLFIVPVQPERTPAPDTAIVAEAETAFYVVTKVINAQAGIYEIGALDHQGNIIPGTVQTWLSPNPTQILKVNDPVIP